MTVQRLQPYAVTIFAEMSALAGRLGAVNLGQGFPDEDGPAEMLKVAQNAMNSVWDVPMKREPNLIRTLLRAVVMLVVSFLLLLTINMLQAWTRRRGGKS